MMRAKSKINYRESFPNGEFSSNYIENEERTLLAAIDSEFTNKNANENICISWQASTLNMITGIHESAIKYVDYEKEERLTLTEVLFFLFALGGVKKSDINGYHVILIAHFFTAEFSMLKDRETIFPFLEILYKTLITFNPIKLTFNDEEENEYNITLEVADTMILLPPSHRSLDKATSLLDFKYHKKELTLFEKKNMLELLHDNKTRFEEYAIHDAVITLMLFIKLQYILNSINGTRSTRYKTIGSATVKHFKSFIKNNFEKGFFESQFSNKNEIYQQGLSLVKRSYMGGLNTSFYIGEMDSDLFLDIDFSSAYSSVMGLIQEGDYGEEIEFTEEGLKMIPDLEIVKIEKFEEKLGSFDGTYLPIAIADAEYKFPDDTPYPNLCVKHHEYGLISPLVGRTVATITEIHLAIRMGCKVIIHDAFVIETGEKYLFKGHLKGSIDARNKAKKDGDELRQQMFKLLVNTLYGKGAQGINPKSKLDLRDENRKSFGTSPITQPFIASMVTGTLRAALSAILVAMDELNKEGHDYIPISATTDGLLYKVSSKANVKFPDCLKPEYRSNVKESLEKGGNIFGVFADVDPILYKKLLEFPVIRLLQSSRQSWGYDEFLEIKHAVNSVLNIKTRVQIGAYNEK